MSGARQKRKARDTADGERGKRVRLDRAGQHATVAASASGSDSASVEKPPQINEPNATAQGPSHIPSQQLETNASNQTTAESKPGFKIKKLVPPRPFPTVATSVSATGPRSSHAEGKNYIAITRKTGLGAYLRRCKDAVLKDGYKTLHLSAMGAAIPQLTTLTISLPLVLPFAANEIRTDILTGTVEVQDELVPDDEDEDISYRTRGKSTLSVVITIGDGVDEKPAGGGKWGPRGKRRGRGLPHPPPQKKTSGVDHGEKGPEGEMNVD